MQAIRDFNKIAVIKLNENLMTNGYPKVVHSEFFKTFDPTDIRVFLHVSSIYCYPTSDLIDLLKPFIKNGVEIGCGYGVFANELQIPATDLKLQNRPEIKERYLALGQPIINYPEYVEELDAHDAILKYSANTVFATWVSGCDPVPGATNYNMFGPNESILVNNVDTYILVGNIDVHFEKLIMHMPHHTFYYPNIISRGIPSKNRIWIWSKSITDFGELEKFRILD